MKRAIFLLTAGLLLSVSCQSELSASATATASARAEVSATASATASSPPTAEDSSDEPQGEATVTPTTSTINATAPENEHTPTEDELAAWRQLLSGVLPFFLMNSDYQILESLMGDAFMVNTWQGETNTLTPSEVTEELRLNLLPNPDEFRFTNDESVFPDLGDVDPTKVFGCSVYMVDLVYSGGWGPQGEGEALLVIGLKPEGQYWPGMIYAPDGFGERQENPGLATYINEHAGYAFDYPGDWNISGLADPERDDYVIILKSFKMSRGIGTVSEDDVKLDFFTCSSARCNSMEALQASVDEQVAAGMLEILSEEEWTLPGGIPAIRRQSIDEMGIEFSSLMTAFNGQGLIVSGFGDLSAFDNIVSTLRPIGTQPSANGLRAVLELPGALPVGEPVKLNFILKNESEIDLYVLKWLTPLEGIGGDIFKIKKDGKNIRYQGILASRADPGPESYVLIEAGGVATAEVDLAEAYDFSQPGRYSIEFLSPRSSDIAASEEEMATSLEELGPVEIPSNEAFVEVVSENHLSSDAAGAAAALNLYFTLLDQGRYSDAVALHGAGFQVLEDWNPSADPEDLAGLLEAGCTTNGLACLPLKTVVELPVTDSGLCEFAVQFANPDGSLFVLDIEGDWGPRSLFNYTVAKTDDGFTVQELPITLP